ncbi:MAG: transcriptional repressor [Oscillospiraceae bacterium]
MEQLRKSKQRDAILNNLKNRYDHPTAMELFLSVRNEIPSLSLGTLYRNLSQLCENGTIISLSSGGEEHFDANVNQHYHLKCNSCGRYYDLPSPPIEALAKACSADFMGKITGYTLIFYGTCEECFSQ